ncbi:MAG: hypothetical protein QM607_09715 [Microbacterium sp.]
MASVLARAGCGQGGDSDAPLQASVGDKVTAIEVSDGDLWPSCWSDDDALYAVNGDGVGSLARGAVRCAPILAG